MSQAVRSHFQPERKRRKGYRMENPDKHCLYCAIKLNIISGESVGSMYPGCAVGGTVLYLCCLPLKNPNPNREKNIRQTQAECQSRKCPDPYSSKPPRSSRQANSEKLSQSRGAEGERMFQCNICWLRSWDRRGHQGKAEEIRIKCGL